jgi:MOSC domain-containing protein YiiM
MLPDAPFSPSEKGIVIDILLAPARGVAMASVAEVEAMVGRGLAGDYRSTKAGLGPDKNLTLIESENIRSFVEATGFPFSAEDARRNIVTAGIRLNDLLGAEFWVGAVRVKALELCEPCSLLAKRTHRAVLWGLVGKGGLRCQILVDGLIRRGDKIGLNRGPAGA